MERLYRFLLRLLPQEFLAPFDGGAVTVLKAKVAVEAGDVLDILPALAGGGV